MIRVQIRPESRLITSFTFVICVWFVQKVRKLTANLDRIQREHRNTLANLEKEKKLRLEQLRAAQVRGGKLKVAQSNSS